MEVKMGEKWYSDEQCQVCGQPVLKEEHLCQLCFDKLQTHYAQVCLYCKSYTFVEWTPENVEGLARKLQIPYNILYETSLIVIIPYRVCSKCDTNKEGYCG